MGRDEHVIDPTGQQGRPERHGLLCPECGALRAPDNTPSCSCARRAAETLHDTRTTEAAAAEDFNPLRIRPYVELDGAGASAKGADRGRPTVAPGAVARRAPRTRPAHRARPARRTRPTVS